MFSTAPRLRVRRDSETLIADLEAQIEALKAKAARKRAKANPAVRHTVAAVRSIDKAMASATDAVLRRALEAARGTLSAYLALQGVTPTAKSGGRSTTGRRSPEDFERMSASLLTYVSKNPGHRGEQIAEALGTDTKTMRLPMQNLIAEGAVRTKGERRGTRYYLA